MAKDASVAVSLRSITTSCLSFRSAWQSMISILQQRFSFDFMCFPAFLLRDLRRLSFLQPARTAVSVIPCQ